MQQSIAAPRVARFEALDAIRGVCAVLVMMMHSRFLTGYDPFPSAYMAVDLFFMMSGFVIAYAYEAKLRRGGYLWTFAYRRYARLWPMWSIGVVIGATMALLLALRGHGSLGGWTLNFVLTMLLVVNPTEHYVFSPNAPGWSLFFELIANFLYALCIGLVGIRSLLAVIIVAALGLGVAAFGHGDLDGGATLDTLQVGAVRVGFGFFLGVLFFHLPRPKPFGRAGLWPLASAIAVIILLFHLVPAKPLRPIYDWAMIVFALPAIIWIALKTDLRGARWAEGLGLLSYPLYTIHFAIMIFLSTGMGIATHWRLRELPVPVVAVLMLALIAVAYWLGSKVDPAIQRLLARKFDQRPIELPKIG